MLLLANALVVSGIIVLGSALSVLASEPRDAPPIRRTEAVVSGAAIESASPSPDSPSPMSMEEPRPILDPVPVTPALAPALSTPQTGSSTANLARLDLLVDDADQTLTAGHVVRPAGTVPRAAPTPTSIPVMPPPTHISIPVVGIDADVIEVSSEVVDMEGQAVRQWQVADWAAGHHDTSANPGEGGNIVIAGHDDVRGEVFRGLHVIQIGDDVYVTSAAGTYHYVVEEIHYRREKGVPLAERLAVGGFFAPMPEERLTLVTCWPYGIDDHRLIVVAKPANR